MGYRANRVGIAELYEYAEPSVFDISGSFLSSKDAPLNNSYSRAILPVIAAQSQFGVVRTESENSGTIIAGTAVAFGILMSNAEVEVGNAMLWEVGVSFSGYIPEGFGICHRFGRADSIPVTAFNTALADRIPDSYNVQNALVTTGTDVSFRRYNSLVKVMVRDEAIQEAPLVSMVEVFDMRQPGASDVPGMQDWKIAMSCRAVYNEQVLRPYDPFR